MNAPGYIPPPYPYDRLNRLKLHGEDFVGGLVDLSVGTPRDPIPNDAADALAASAPSAMGYPPSIGTEEVRTACSDWVKRRIGATIPADQIAVCVGTKEFVASTPHLLKLRDPGRDTVLYPAVSYPSYAMGAELAGCRAVPVPVDDQWRLRLDAIDAADIARALCLWVNTPGNPAGGLDDLAEVVRWGRANDVVVLSDECYFEFTWDAPYGANPITGVVGRSVLEHGSEGLVAVHSLSKRSNFAGGRAGFFTGDPDLVAYLAELRKHLGLMVPGPIQAAATVCWDDQAHVEIQRAAYHDRLESMVEILAGWGLSATMPKGGFYLWVPAPDGDGWALTEHLAREVGLLASPGSFYGEASDGFVRLAMVDHHDRLELLRQRGAAANLNFA